ncbi:MAG: pyridoxal-dependent decarboxylase, partial [Terracidiphilus sp.]
LTPFLVVGTAGTVNTGAVDDLSGLADFCRRENLWFHVDGAFGALARLAPDLAPKLDGIERADSLAFDFHKWGQAPYDAGFVLVRDAAAHKNAFASPAAYLERADRGLAAGSPWPCDFGPDLSRGFRALKVWFTLKVFGLDELGASISGTCRLARYLESRIVATPELELLAPVELNIVCFRYRPCNPDPVHFSPDDSDRINREIVIALQESGVVAPSTTRIDGRVAIRAAIVNHRTSQAEIDALVDHALAHGRALTASAPPSANVYAAPRIPSSAHLQSALQVVERELTARPGSTALLFLRGNLLELTERKPEARQAYTELLALDPAHQGALNRLGSLHSAAGENDAARKAYSVAVAAHPRDPMSLVNLANLLRNEGETEQARAHFERAIGIDPDFWQAHLGLSAIFAGLGDEQQAALHRKAAFRGRCVVPLTYRGNEPPIPVLELVAIGRGNTRIKNFLSDTLFQRYLVAAEFYEPATPLPPHQLIVNAIGDADAAPAALAGAEALVARSSAPVINPPAAVLATGRCAISERLSHLPGVVTARTLAMPRAALCCPEAPAALLRQRFRFPLLLRSSGFHGGENFLRVEDASRLQQAAASLPGDELMVIEFLDARGEDGKTRKYRVMTIDGALYPLHAAVSHDWKIHYFSAEMAENSRHRAEDAAFLADMNGVLGAKAIRALEEIQSTLGLDYGGIDFGLSRAGDLLLFEANATMAVLPPGEDARWDYRRPAVERILRAIRKMFVDRVKEKQAESAMGLPTA